MVVGTSVWSSVKDINVSYRVVAGKLEYVREAGRWRRHGGGCVFVDVLIAYYK
jgi:hypothetical protein